MNSSKMKNTLISVFHISTVSMANRLIYYIKRLPLIGKAVSDGLYAQTELKQGLAIVAALLYTVYRFFCKAVYIGLMVAFPLFLMAEDADPAARGAMFVHIFFFLSFLAGAVQAPKALENKPNKYICIRLVGIGPPGLHPVHGAYSIICRNLFCSCPASLWEGSCVDAAGYRFSAWRFPSQLSA